MTSVPNFAPWINIAVGIMTIISPFAVPGSSHAMVWSGVIAGIIIGVVAIIELAMYPTSHHMNYWPVINILAGVWLFISTSFAQGNAGAIWSDIVLGVTAIIVAVVGLGYERIHAIGGQPTAR